ncbi:MAG: hypothetical protein IJN04_01300 [Clostridia bacterium]|nr:hypothetical protein [Clostridia bacterium]
MQQAIAYLMEPLLTQFFLLDAICQGFIDETRREETFRELAQVFGVPMNAETLAYFEAADAPHYKNITDNASYERLCRTIEFARHSGQDVGLTATDRVILAQKREAMAIKEALFEQSRNLTADLIADTLLTTAMNGNVDAMVTLAYMEYHGLCLRKDTVSALKRIRLCAEWNHLFGNLMGIAYDKRHRATYYNTLYTVLRSSHQREVFDYLCEAKGYDETCEKLPTARIIDRAFGLGIIKRNEYDSQFAKVAFSPLISDEDKKKLLLNKRKGAIEALSDLPFDVEREPLFAFDADKAKAIPLDREEEMAQVLCSLYPAVSNRPEMYRTLLVAGDDAYVNGMYVAAVRDGFAAHNKVIEVDAGNLTLQDFAGSKEHFILRGLSETGRSHTVFLVKHCEEIGQREQEELIKLLDYECRRKFNLAEPTVSLDLSDVLIVLFAGKSNDAVRRLAQECDVVRTARISEAEKRTVVDNTFRTRARSFGLSDATLEEPAAVYLLPFNTEQIVLLIDGALKQAAYRQERVITAESLRTVSDRQNIHGSNRRFGYPCGYMGGAYHEEY